MIIEKTITVLENLSMIGKIKKIDLLMIGKTKALAVGNVVIVVIVKIQMINIHTKGKIKDKIKDMRNQPIDKSRLSKIIKIKKC